jgi:hypothetical protein
MLVESRRAWAWHISLLGHALRRHSRTVHDGTHDLMTYGGKIDLQSIRVPIYFHLALHDRIFLIGATSTQWLEVTVPGVSKSGIAYGKSPPLLDT